MSEGQSAPQPLFIAGCPHQNTPRMAVVDIDSTVSKNDENVQDKHSTFRSYCVSARLKFII